MKSVIKYLPILILIACGKPGNEEIKKQIDKKKGQVAKLEQQISELRSKLIPDTSAANNKANAHLVAVQEIQPRAFMHYIEVQGSLDGDENLAVFPEAMGTVTEIYVKVGQRVNKGQKLASLDDAALKEQIKALESNLELSSSMYNKIKTLWDQKIGSEVQYLQAKTAKESLDAQLAAANSQLNMMYISSPINGTVEESSVKVGQTASPQYPAFRVVNFGKLKVIAEVAEAYASKIKVGDELSIYLPDINKEYLAQVDFASNYINQVNRTFRIEAILKESDTHMKANMVSVLKINDYKNDKAIILSMNYIQKDQSGTFVFIAEQSGDRLIASKRAVTTGQIYNGVAEILSGLNPGDKLITLGYLDVEAGESVKL